MTQAVPQRRPRRHWKHCRFVPTDDFVWAKNTTWEGRPVLMGDPVDKEAVGRKKLLRLFRARFIEPVYVPSVPKDPQAAPTYPAEDLQSAAA